MQMLQKSCIFKINTCIFIKNVIHCCGDILKSFCIHEDLFCGEVVILVCRKQKREVREPPLRRRDKLCSVPIFEMKISHTLRCPSFSAKSHVCECLVFINAHIYAFAALPSFHGGSRTRKRREKIKTGSGTQNGRPRRVAPTVHC